MRKTEVELPKDEGAAKKHIIEVVKAKLKSLMEDDSPENRRKIVCPYFQDSTDAPECVVCEQPEDILEDCTSDYKTLVRKVPSLVFKKEYWKNKTREKTPIVEIDFLGLNCDVCYIRDACPEQQDGSMCAIDWSVNGGKKMTATDVLDFMIGIQMDRVKRAQLFEQIDGGMPDENLSKELEKLRVMNGQRINMMQDKFSLKIEATSNHRQVGEGGILSKIFGIGQQKAITDERAETINISHEEQPVERTEKRGEKS